MPQRPKPEMRDAILRAAGATFAEVGLERATLGEIVERAGTSIGNLYKYFANKQELLQAFLPRGFGRELTRRIRAQVEALRGEPSAFAVDAGHPYRRASEELLRFTLEHRDRIVFLLLRAERTEHAGLADEIVRVLVRLALEHARATYPGFVVTAARRRALTRIYQAFVSTLGSILEQEREARALREAVALHASYHLSGLAAFFQATGQRLSREGGAT